MGKKGSLAGTRLPLTCFSRYYARFKSLPLSLEQEFDRLLVCTGSKPAEINPVRQLPA
jgi:hypothetical protein